MKSLLVLNSIYSTLLIGSDKLSSKTSKDDSVLTVFDVDSELSPSPSSSFRAIPAIIAPLL